MEQSKEDAEKIRDAEKDSEAVSRPVTLEEQAAFRKAVIGRKGQADE